MQGRSRKETGAAPRGPWKCSSEETLRAENLTVLLAPSRVKEQMAMLGLTGFSGGGGLPFLPPPQNELSPFTHSLIHSFTRKSIIFTFTHSLKKNKTKPKPTGWVPKSYVRG